MTRTLNILMVEDVIIDAEMVARHLKTAGLQCQITRIETEPAFRSVLTGNPPDIILSDFSLPRFSGMDALQIAVELAPDIPFVFVSGTIGEDCAIEALRRGATDYVLKTNLMRLVPVIERALGETAIRTKQRFTEKLLLDIVETSQDWIWQLDAAGRFTFSSPAVRTILGYDPAELLGRSYNTMRIANDSDPPALPDPKEGTTALIGSLGRWRHRNGEVRWLERNATIILGKGGELVGFRGTDRDVTVRREQDLRIQRLSRVHRMLSNINSAIIRISDRDELFTEACRIARDLGGYELVLVKLVIPGTLTMKPVASAGFPPESLAAVTFSLDVRAHPTMTAEAIQSGKAVICNELRTDPRTIQLRDRLEAAGIQSIVVLPLLVDGTGIGSFVFCSRAASFFDDSEVAALTDMVANIGFALQYFEKQTTVNFLSYFDPSTGLAKRNLFCERLARKFQNQGESGSTTSVVVFDVQRLGLINDSYGRHVTDRLLENIADRLKRQIEDSESAAHFGGGTFAAAFPNRTDADGTGRWLQSEASRVFIEPFLIDGHEIRPAIRSGMALFPTDGQVADTVVQNAEAALSYAKESDERHVVYGLLDRTKGGDDRVRFEARLGGALQRSEFVLHYQPKVNVQSGQVEGVEALIRWQDPESGLIGPVRFIPLLESTGLIFEVGQWVLEQAARDCQKWLRAGLPPIRVAVNVSPVQLRRSDFVRRAIATIDRWATESAGLDIEITESSLMQDVEASTRKLEALREAGMRVSIDDFGAGYSSLRQLANLPIDTLKIDQSFIHGITDRPQSLAIVETIVALARSCAMSTVAEGVETPDQLRLLRSTRCDQIQGYLFSRPVAAELLPEVLSRLNSGVQTTPVATQSVGPTATADRRSRK